MIQDSDVQSLSEAEKIHLIQELKAELANAHRTQTMFTTLVEKSSDYVSCVDTDGRHIYANEAVLHELGQSPDEIIGKTGRDLGLPEAISTYIDRMQKRVLRSGQEVTFDYTLETRIGVRHLLTQIIPQTAPDGAITALMSHTQDITARKQAEESLRHSQARLRALVDHARHAIWSIDRDHRLLVFNDHFRQLYQTLFSVEIEAGDNVLDALPDDLRADWRGYYDRALHGEGLDMTLNNGAHAYDVSLAPIYEQGTVTGVTGCSWDVTSHRTQARQLMRQQATYRTLIDRFPNGMVAFFDPDLRFIVAGGEHLYQAGIDPEAFVGRRLDELFPPEIAERDMPHLQATLRGHRTTSEVPYEDGVYRVHTIPITDDDGTVTGGIVMSQDITQERVAAEHRLSRERMDILMDFVQDASHEFRTPLTRIGTAVHMLRKRAAEDKTVQRYVDRIQGESDRLVSLVDDLLTMVQLDRGTSFTQEPMSLYITINEGILDALPERDRITCDITPDVPVIWGDPHYLRRAFQEIIDNALRHSQDAPVTITTSTRADRSLVVLIHDDGPGMDANTLDHIFDRFYRLDDQHTTHGFGLGLAIARQIITGHGGTIHAESAPGYGTTIHVTLPC
jgi:PAS domain S-box-containing protein